MIRFAILAGVSTDAQAAEDKQSIPDQVKHCRDRIRQLGGIESAGPYIMDGYSRSGYDSLDLAMQEIPPLGDAIRAAHADQYDALIMDNFDRLGDLGFNVKTRFKKLRKQLYSARQSSKLAAPSEYDPYASEEADFAMFAQSIIQTYRINKLRRAWNVGVPERAESGLHPLSTPFGYRAGHRGEPAAIVEHEAKLIVSMKDLYLRGISLQDICRYADASGIKSPRGSYWHRNVIKRIVTNPYYAGETIFGKYKTVGGKRIPQPPSAWRRGKGKHQPLWDHETYLMITAEHERRQGVRMRNTVYALTGVLVCSVCGTNIHRHGGEKYIYLNCRAKQSHISARYDILLKLAADAVITALREHRDKPQDENAALRFDERIAAQHTLRKRIQEGYEGGLYNQQEAHQRIVSVETEIERLQRARDRALQSQHQHGILRQLTASEQDLERLRNWIIGDTPEQVNQFLTALCRIIVTPSLEMRVSWTE